MGVISTSQIFGLTIRESANDGSDFTNPAADYRRLFLGEDGEMHTKDSAGSVAGFAGTGIAATLADAQGDLLVASAADTWAKLTKGTAGQGLIANSTTLVYTDILPWHHYIPPQIATPDATTGTWANTAPTDSGLVYPFYTPGSTANSGGAGSIFNSSGAQNDAWAIDVILAQGTWDFHCWVRKSTNTGIVTLQQDGSDMGTVDTYAAAAAAAKVSITGWAVSATGKKRMNLKIATKNASSSGYVFTMFGIEFRRTA